MHNYFVAASLKKAGDVKNAMNDSLHFAALALASFVGGYQLSDLIWDRPEIQTTQPLQYQFDPLTESRESSLDEALEADELSVFARLTRQIQWMSSISNNELAAVYNRIEATGDDRFLHLLRLYWAERDPDGAIDYIRHHLDSNEDFGELVLTKLAFRDPQKAVASAKKIGHTGLLSDANRSFLARHDRRKVKADLLKSERKPTFIATIFEAMALQNVESAAAQALQLRDRDARRQAVRGVGKKWAASDPKSALAWADGLERASLRDEARRAVLMQWIADEPETAARHVLSLPQSIETTLVYEKLASEWAKVSPEDSIAWIRQHTSGETQSEVLMSAFSEIPDPGATAQLLVAHELSELHPKLFDSLVTRWAGESPQMALTWSENLAGHERDVAVGAALSGVAIDNPEVALAYLSDLSDNDAIATAHVGGVAEGLMERDLVAGLGLLNEYREGMSDQEYNGLATRLLSEASKDNPELASTLLDELGILEPIAESHRTRMAINQITNNWVGVDRAAAETWVENLPPGFAREQGADALSRYLVSIDPVQAFNWANLISDFRQRTNLVSNLFGDLPKTADVPKLLAASSLSDTDKTHLQKDLRMHGHLPR